jgi:hypothetical protein
MRDLELTLENSFSAIFSNFSCFCMKRLNGCGLSLDTLISVFFNKARPDVQELAFRRASQVDITLSFSSKLPASPHNFYCFFSLTLSPGVLSSLLGTVCVFLSSLHLYPGMPFFSFSENIRIMDNVLFCNFMLDISACWGWNICKFLALLVLTCMSSYFWLLVACMHVEFLSNPY